MEPIYFKDDVVEIYSKRRKNFPKRDVEDLLDCMISFMKNKIKEEEHYAIKIPRFGYMYTKDTWQRNNSYITDMTNNKFLSNMFIEMCYETDTPYGVSLLQRKEPMQTQFGHMTLEEIQENQNNSQ